MLLQQHLQQTPNYKITDEEALVWCYRNANTEWNNANNGLEVIINFCNCSAKEVDFVKMIRLQIDYVSEHILNSDNSSQTLIHNTKDSNCSQSDEYITKTMETEKLKNLQILLRKKFRLLSIMRKELTHLKCECINNWNNNINSNNNLRKSEFNCQMWFRQIKLIEAKIKCNRELVPFDPISITRQLLENNELNLNLISNNFDSNSFDSNSFDSNNFHSNNIQLNNDDIKIQKFITKDDNNDLAANDYIKEDYSKEYENDMRNMQILRYDPIISLNGENSTLVLQPININDMTTTLEMDCEVRTFQELHPISTNTELNYSAHEISVVRSNSLFHEEFDYNTNANQVSDDILPQMTAIEIDQILNN